MRFADRYDAGRQLGPLLRALADEDPLVLALPRGGVPVASEVARAIGAPLDVLVSRKIGAPFQPELAIGAVAEGGALWIDRGLCRVLDLAPADVEPMAETTRRAVEAQVAKYRGTRPLPDVTNRAVIIVDDGLATGATARAAIAAVRPLRPRRIVLAVPVAAAQTTARLRAEVDELVAVYEPTDLTAVGQWYADFSPVEDDEVAALLAGHGRAEATHSLDIALDTVTLRADLVRPATARGLVVFAHGSGSGRSSPRNRAVARTLQQAGLATLLVDLLSEREQLLDARSGSLRFDIVLLATRLAAIVDWAAAQPSLRALPVGLFGSSTGAAAAMLAAAARPARVSAVVSRGGRVDLAEAALHLVRAATLLVVGSEDDAVLELNERALAELGCEKQLFVVEGAGHLFEEPGALEIVAGVAARWFATHLVPPTRREARPEGR